MKLFLKLISSYEPSIEDFQDYYLELPTGSVMKLNFLKTNKL